MHPNRRRKKRPNYGIRTVEVARGPNGFGFTISGQQPCILSCIVKDSPADYAGLRAGDFLISVNDVSVSKTTHDAVVNLIGSCIGPIKMTIAENYYSDSSDEELEASRMITCRKPKHKPRSNRNHRLENRKINNVSLQKSSDHKCVLKYSNGSKEALNPLNLSTNSEDQASSREYKALVGYLGSIETTKQFTTDGRIKGLSFEEQGGPIEYKALVGYLGTIEMPKQLSPDTRLQTVCNCIKKLRQEKRSPTAVLMTVLPTCLTLKNASNHILAIYPTNRVVYVGSARDKDSRYFGLVTSAICDLSPKENGNEWDSNLYVKKSNADIGISNSCHIFVTDPKLIDHNVHVRKAEAFNIMCSADPVSGRCLEFPKDSLYIVSLIQSMYKLQCETQKSNKLEDRSMPLVANSPQPSASSNSDSGIGFRDDFNTISDRIVLVEFPARELGCTSNNKTQDCPNLEDNLNNDGIRHAESHRFNFELTKPNDLLKMVLNNEKKPLNYVQNLRAYESLSIKNSFGGTKMENMKNNNEIETRLNNFSSSDKLNCKSLLNKLDRNVSPSSFTSSDDNTKTSEVSHAFIGGNHNEHEVSSSFIFNQDEMSQSLVVPQQFFAEKSEDFEFKRSVDNLSMCSSKSLEFGNVMSVFKTPSTSLFERKAKQASKLASSCDNLDKCGENKKKPSPKHCGMSKPNYSYEELNNFDFGQQLGYGSLNNLFFANRNVKSKKNREIARSEPDVRLQNGKSVPAFLLELLEMLKSAVVYRLLID
ncbi:hypothetical protein HHI36_003503 [Cryptolaemus montrouzieri]|uniref:Regulator of G-protein signaling loco n=1 Tax=Cryptolaemus montrouzieri TaxID=559131 RepID=A0ABD2PEC2_9CUCU